MNVPSAIKEASKNFFKSASTSTQSQSLLLQILHIMFDLQCTINYSIQGIHCVYLLIYFLHHRRRTCKFVLLDFLKLVVQMARSDVSILKEFMSEKILAIENILKDKNVKGLKSLVMELKSLGTTGLEAIDKQRVF